MNAHYTDEDKKDAFLIYKQTGKLSAVLREMKKKYPTLNISTVSKWSKEKDERGNTWKDNLKEIKTLVTQKRNTTFAEFKAKYTDELLQIKENIHSELSKLEFSSKEAALNALDKTNTRLQEQYGFDPKNEENKLKIEQARHIIEGLFSILRRHSVVGIAISQHYHELEKDLIPFYKEIEKMLKKEKASE